MNDHIQNTTANVGTTLALGSAAFSHLLGEISPVLQALGYLVGIISGICATVYYVSRTRRR